MQREGWQLDSCPLLKPHELSASSVVNPQVTTELTLTVTHPYP